jgi:hypothetical protein
VRTITEGPSHHQTLARCCDNRFALDQLWLAQLAAPGVICSPGPEHTLTTHEQAANNSMRPDSDAAAPPSVAGRCCDCGRPIWLPVAAGPLACAHVCTTCIDRAELADARIQPDLQWQVVERRPAPFNADLELSVIDIEGLHALIFPCHRTVGGWVHSNSQKRIALRPTHPFSSPPPLKNARWGSNH